MDKGTTIHVTKNWNQGTGSGQYDTACVAIVDTETMKIHKNEKVTWKIDTKSPGNSDDDCPASFDISKLSIVVHDPMVINNQSFDASNKKITADVIGGNNGRDGAPHKYQVMFNDGTSKPAGPDPIIVVDCPSCA